MHIYAFGSLCRGEIGLDSDIDLLAIADHYNPLLDKKLFSIYSYRRIQELWLEGNPFSWHLSLEARLIYGFDERDYLRELGTPNKYQRYVDDCHKFFSLFKDARISLDVANSCTVFDLSTIFLGIRNFASCFSLGVRGVPDFSRNSATHLGDDSIPIDAITYRIFERARILCTRGYGPMISLDEIRVAIQSLSEVDNWMSRLYRKAEHHERLQ
jgi:hypothetical protein